jgi:aspartyl-tRNA(Asn)/glutamyl-tRNA(Gln) amidotransferase subunit A
MQENLFSHVDLSAKSAMIGPLAGRSVVIQPNMSARGWPCEAGSVALERFAALEDATIIERLRGAGAIILGSTRMAELGFGLIGDTTARVFAEGLCDVALVTDTMGEARHTASLARAYGFKPSYGVISRFGLIGLIPSMECCGIVANTPTDVAAAMAVLAGADERDPSMLHSDGPDFAKVSERQAHVAVAGVIRECIDALQPVESEAFGGALSKLEAAGVRTEEVSMPGFELFRLVHNVVGSAEASSSAGKYDGVRYGHRTANADNWNEMYLKSRAESFGLLVKSYLFQGAYFQFQNYPAFENACRIRRRLVQKIQALLEKVDVLVCPAQRSFQDKGALSTIEEVYDTFALTLPANVTGQPSLSVPGFVTNGGLDLGLQLVGAPLADVQLLSFAARLARLDSGRGNCEDAK